MRIVCDPALGGLRRRVLIGLATLAATPLHAQIAPVVVTATRIEQSSADLPVSIDRLDREQIGTGQLQVNLSETLDEIPGVVAQNRQNYAQDLQLSLRGFGARSSFGVRGVRLYSDGIPGTMPDGQGQFSQFDLGSAGRVEVLRGPFSALYGNSSGGVIALFTEDGPPGNDVVATVEAGSLGTQRYAFEDAGDTGSVNYVVDGSHFLTDGYRGHSEAERNLFNTKVRLELGNGAKLTFVVNAIETPFVEDPLGLTRIQWQVNPTQAGNGALLYDTRKSLDQEQAGAIYEQPLGSSGDLSATAYGGHRQTTQYQSIPAISQKRATSPGGVIDLAHGYGGLDVHATERYVPGGTPLRVTLGTSYDQLDEDRRGYLNFVGSDLGIEGALRRDEFNRVYDSDQYLEAQWDPSARWRIIAGLRNSTVDVADDDHLPAPNGATGSGVRYAATDPIAGVTWRVLQRLNLYAAYGKGFETPTLNDLAYRSTDGSIPGLNIGLRAAHSDNYEVGAKAGGESLSGSFAVFYVRTRDELAVAANAYGRSVYQNIGETQRKGTELELHARPAADWSARLAYTYIQALTVTPYSTCVTLPCTPTLIPAGNRLPAVPGDSLYFGLTWQHAGHGPAVTVEALARSQIYVDDRNSDAAPGYRLFNAHATLVQELRSWRLSESLRIDNLGNRRYVGTVIVNQTSSQYFEPDPGRTAYLMFTAAFRNP